MMSRNYIYKLLFCSIILCLSSCSIIHDEIDESTKVSVTFQIGAAETSITKADENAAEGEFMNTLQIFIVDDNQGYIEKKINATTDNAFTSKLTGNGSVTDYSVTVDLFPGKKSIYVFSNMEGAKVVGKTQTLEQILAEKTQGRLWNISSADNIDNFIIENPAAGIDLTDNFIPMSAKRTNMNLSTDGQTVHISLVRLVSKVRAQFTNAQNTSVQINSLTIGQFADRVSLFDDVEAAATYNQTVVKTFDTPIEVTSGSTVDLFYTKTNHLGEVYVNETKQSAPLLVSLGLEGTEPVKGTTTSRNIPRNSILPLGLKLGANSVELIINAYVAPIGGMPVTVYAGGLSLTNNYTIQLPEGCYFDITGNSVNKGNTLTPITDWTWTVTSGPVQLDVSNAQKIEGHLTAMPGQTAVLNYSTADASLTGTLTITTIPLDDSYPKTKAFRWNEVPHLFESVILGN